MRCARGQGTVEYLAVVLLVAVVLGGTATATAVGPAGARIATAVPHQALYALCLLTGGDCDRDTAPCDVGSQTASHQWSVRFSSSRAATAGSSCSSAAPTAR